MIKQKYLCIQLILSNIQISMKLGFLLDSSVQCLRLSSVVVGVVVLTSFCWLLQYYNCLWFRYWILFLLKWLEFHIILVQKMTETSIKIHVIPISSDVHNEGLISVLNVTDFSLGDGKLWFLSNCSPICSTAVIYGIELMSFHTFVYCRNWHGTNL